MTGCTLCGGESCTGDVDLSRVSTAVTPATPAKALAQAYEVAVEVGAVDVFRSLTEHRLRNEAV